MRTFYGLMLLVVLVATFSLSYRKTKDILSPLCIYSFLQGLRYIPGILSYDVNMGIVLNDDTLLRTFVFETIAILSTVIGYEIASKVRVTCSHRIKHEKKDKLKPSLTNDCNDIYRSALLCLAIGTITTLLYIRKIGGISSILQDTKAIYDGTTYYTMISFLCICAGVLLITTANRKFIPLIIVSYVIYVFPYLLQLRRSTVLEPLLYFLIAYHYGVKNIRIKDILKPKILIIMFTAMIFIVAVPSIRNSRDITTSSDVISNVLKNFTDSIEQIVKEFCYVGRDTFVYNNYNIDNYYYGRPIINLLCSPIPSTVFTAKPPVDDGLYLYNFMKGHYIAPPAINFPLFNSVPFSTQGSMYANFGFFGVILGCTFCGALYKRVYNRLLQNKRDAFSIILYLAVLYQLELSSLSIVQTLIPVTITYLFLKIITYRKRYASV